VIIARYHDVIINKATSSLCHNISRWTYTAAAAADDDDVIARFEHVTRNIEYVKTLSQFIS